MRSGRGSVLAAAAVACGGLAWAGPAWSAVFLSLELEPTRAQVGEAVSVRYTVRIRDQGAVRIMPLEFGELQLLSDPSPPQVPMMWGAGFGFSIDTANEYLVRAPRPGRYLIAGARAVDPQSGRVIATAPPVTLVVGDVSDEGADGGVTAGEADAAGLPPADPDAPPPGDLTGADYNLVGFLRVGVDRPRVYLGEQVMYRVWAYSSSPDAGCELSEEPTFPGFWNESALTPTRECAQRWFSQQVNGRFMAIGLMRKWALFATQTGVQRFGATAGRVDVMTGGMFRQVRRSESRTPQVEVEVLEPPLAGRPEGYVPGTIGPIVLEAAADRPTCATGETATISVRARSEGSLASAQLFFERNFDGARVRAAEGRTVIEHGATGRFETVRTTDVLVVPERAGVVNLGEARMAYWDPGAGRYGVATVALPVVRAEGAAVSAGPAALEREDPELALRPLSPAPRLRGYAPTFARGPAALAAAFAPAGAAALGSVGLAVWRWRRRVSSERERVSRDDPRSLLQRAREALERDEQAALGLAQRALARAQAELAESELRAGPEVERLVGEARAALDAARFAGEGRAVDAVSTVERAVSALLEVA
jgi:hypothetical protein